MISTLRDDELLKLAYACANYGADLTRDKDMLKRWNPLKNGGDALMLAARLKLHIRIDEDCVSAGVPSYGVGAPTHDGKGPWYWQEKDDGDILETTCRAIVTCAAYMEEARK